MNKRKYLDVKSGERLPFFSPYYSIENNVMHHTWSNLTDILPNGHGVCLDLVAGSGKHRHVIESKGWRWIDKHIPISGNWGRVHI